MPELPEAETIARQLHRELAGRTIGRVTLLRPDIVHAALPPLPAEEGGTDKLGLSVRGCRAGGTDKLGLSVQGWRCAPDAATLLDALVAKRRVRQVRRRAKRVILDLSNDVCLLFRLGMTGQLGVVDSSAPIEKHTHLRIAIAGTCRELRFRDARRFGGLWLVRGNDRELHADLGLEPLDASPKQFRAALARHRQIKALLMDQSVIAGLGNIYCDESLHAARIHPLTRSDRLDAAAATRLLRAIKMTLRRAIRFNGSTLSDYRDADGREGAFQKLHSVYQREGEPCRTCRTPIRRILAAGRSTFFCPKCQRQTQKRKHAKTQKQVHVASACA